MPSSSVSTARELLDVYVGLGRQLNAAGLTASQLAEAITALAVSEIPGTKFASISDRQDSGRFRTLAATDEVAIAGDLIQYELGSGPCVDAILDDGQFWTGNIAEDQRWPMFGRRVHAEAGVMSMLSFRLFYEEQSQRISGLNLYSTDRDAFDETSLIIGTLVATQGSLALAAAVAQEKAAHLQAALTSNRRIGTAMGILMASHKIVEDDAFTLLRIASQHNNRKLLDIAEEVVATGVLELPPPKAQPSSRAGRGGRPHTSTQAGRRS